MIRTMKVIPQNMYAAAQRGFINATDLADYLTKKGMPFRAAYKTVGQIVAYCISGGKVLEDMTLDEYKGFSVDFEDDLYDAISLESCVNRRISEGSTGPAAVAAQIEIVTEFLKNEKH